ncbi:MAG TPA: hypothetical protein VLD19_14560, partial [Chitinophagaceae bacterium]|nr:hypothetical protein [Chitinophagaceae bacterium]
MERKLSEATSDSAQSYICLRLHDAWFKTNQPKSREYAEKALELVKHSDYWLLKGKTYQALARCERKTRNYKKVFPFDSLSLSCAKKANDSNAVFSANMLLARDNLDAEIFPTAFVCLQQCEAISNITKLPAQVAVLNQTLGFYYAQTNRHKLAIPCYEKAIPAFAAIKNDYMVAECKFFMVQSMLALGKTTNAANYVFEALDTYKKLNSAVSQGQCYELLASIYLAEGDVQKGIDYSLQAKDFYSAHNNKIDYALVTFDLVRALLLQKKYTVAATYIAEADSIFNALDYMPGKIRLKTLQGQFYSETGKYELADRYFAEAAVLIKANDLPDVKTEQDKYLAAHQYRLKNYKAADSLTYAYSSRQAREKEPEVLAIELNTLYKRNKNLDSTAFKLLKLLYVPGGPEMLKKKLGNKSLLSVLPVDSLLNNNPFSLAPPAYD